MNEKDELPEITAARNPMKKNKAVYQTFAIKNGLQKRIQ